LALFGRKRPTINDVRLALEGWHLSGRSAQLVQYDHANGDVFSVNFFDVQPDIGASLADVDGIRRFYRDMLVANDMGMIECDVVGFGGVKAVYLLAKLLLEPRGFIFIGSYTLSRRDQSFVLKYQAIESGATGVREASVMAMLPQHEVDVTSNRIVGWCSDPYDDSLEYSVMRNKADAAEFDTTFPDHPLSRTRRFMSELPDQVTMSDTFCKSPEFTR
jgi:hypothetical protein